MNEIPRTSILRPYDQPRARGLTQKDVQLIIDALDQRATSDSLAAGVDDIGAVSRRTENQSRPGRRVLAVLALATTLFVVPRYANDDFPEQAFTDARLIASWLSDGAGGVYADVYEWLYEQGYEKGADMAKSTHVNVGEDRGGDS